MGVPAWTVAVSRLTASEADFTGDEFMLTVVGSTMLGMGRAWILRKLG